MKIRKEQMSRFDSYMTESFYRRMEEHLLHLYPDQTGTFTKEELREFVLAGADNADRYCMDTEQDVARFLELAVLIGLDFDEDPQYVWARFSLEKQLPAESRLDAVFEQLHFETHEWHYQAQRASST